MEMKSGKEALAGRIRNISTSGAYCTVDKFIPLNTMLDVTLLIPESARPDGEKVKRMKCHGLVVRNQPVEGDEANQRYGMALCFANIKKKDKVELRDYVSGTLPPEEQRRVAGEKGCRTDYDPGEVFWRPDVGERGFSVSSANFRVLGTEINLSKNGIVCQTDRQIPLFREIAVNLVLPRREGRKTNRPEALQCSAVVVGCKKVRDGDKYDMAAYFVGLSPEQKKRLDECIKKIF